MSELPVDIIVDILSRLPVEPLLRFRCISKSWCALIDSPKFIKLHLNRSINTNTSPSIIFWFNEPYSIALDSLADDAVKLDNPLKNEEVKLIELVGSYDGLLCLSYSKKDVARLNPSTREDKLPVLALWNPSTRKHHKLPVRPIEFPLQIGSVEFFVTYGFGYDPLSDDYKVMRLIEFYGKGYVSLGSEVVVYSMKSNSWRRIQDFPTSLRAWGTNAVFASGALHWAVNGITEPYRGSLIIAFDLGVEEYRVVPQPDHFDKNDEIYLEVVGGCLCVVCYNDETCVVDIWVMKEYGIKESWTRIISAAEPWFEIVRPLAYSKRGGEVILVEDSGRLLHYDLKMKTVKHIRNASSRLGLRRDMEAHVCLGSLVPLRADGGSDDEICKQKDTNKQKKRKKGW